MSLAHYIEHQLNALRKLKADRLHLPDYPHMPTDYRHTDKHFGLVMALLCSLLFAALGKAEHTQTNK